MEIKYAKKDIVLAVLAGEIITWLSLPTLKNLQILDILAARGIEFKWFMVFWIFFMPAGAVLGLGMFYFIAKIKNRIGFFQLGKYGVIGVLNTLLNAGIYNLLIFITDTSTGLTIDLFFITAFIITVVNSFFWNKYWSFEEKRTETLGKEAVNFFGVSAAVAIINMVTLS